MLLKRFMQYIFSTKRLNALAGVGAALRFEAGFSHSLGIKSAITRTTHPQQHLSKGGGLAKRPQFDAICCNSLLFVA